MWPPPRISALRSADFPWRKRMKRARPSSPRPARSSCRWYQSTAGQSATARPAWWPTPCAAISIVMQKQAEGREEGMACTPASWTCASPARTISWQGQSPPRGIFGRQDIQERLAEGQSRERIMEQTAMAADRSQNLQDTFLNHVRKNKTPLTIFLVNGVKLQGVVTWFDNFCVLLRRDGHSQLVYKHAISTIMPGHPIQLFEGAEELSAGEKA